MFFFSNKNKFTKIALKAISINNNSIIFYILDFLSISIIVLALFYTFLAMFVVTKIITIYINRKL